MAVGAKKKVQKVAGMGAVVTTAATKAKAKTKTAKPPKPKASDLPDTMSGLIKVALKDLRKAERSKDYVIDMGVWHDPFMTLDGKFMDCGVCAAGAVMAFTLHTPKTELVMPLHFSSKLENKLCVIDCLRVGDIDWAARTLKVKPAKMAMVQTLAASSITHIPEYKNTESGREKFHTAMKSLAHALEKVGL